MKSSKVSSVHVLIVALGRHCPPRTSSWQKGRSYQAVGWRFKDKTIPPCHRCWNRTLPTKSDETHGSEKVSPQEQGKTIHQSTFFVFLSGIDFPNSCGVSFRLSTTLISFPHVTLSNWRDWKTRWLLTLSRSHHNGKKRGRRSKNCLRIVTLAERTNGSLRLWE